MHDALLDIVRQAFTEPNAETKAAAFDALKKLVEALASPAAASSTPPSSAHVAASAFAPTPKADTVSTALDALIAKFRSMLPPGVEAPQVEPAFSIPFVPVPSWTPRNG